MHRCQRCNEETDLPYECSYCGRRFCPEHRLPENHHCPGLSSATTLGPEFRPRATPGRSSSATPNPIEPGTVGTREAPQYPSSPDVELKPNLGATEPGSDRSSSWRGVRSVAFVAVIAAVLALGATAYDGSIVTDLGLDGGNGEPIPQAVSDASGTPTASPTATATATPTPDALRAERVERLVHQEVNRIRTDRGLLPLDHDRQLRVIARDHSAVMAEHGTIFHTQPDGDDLQDRFDQHRYTCRVYVDDDTYATGGENVAQTWYRENVRTADGIRYYDTPAELAGGIVEQWMSSRGHRENILRPYWNTEGIGIVIVEADGKTAVYATQDFC